MFIIKFQGALGNQMFEYAFYKKMQQIYPDNIIKGYIGHIPDFNGFELERVFGLKIEQATWSQVARLANNYPQEAPLSALLNYTCKFRQIKYGLKKSHIKEDDNTAYYPQVFDLNPLESYYLDGVWANARYIEDIRNELINDFIFLHALEGKNLEMANKMENENSICIHVRRNEYVSMGLTVTSDNYYKNAVNRIKEQVSNPVFYVFSDDHEYCKKLFADMIPFTIVEGNTKEYSYRDMQLMTHCKHNIIANSTFSFWGAFLGRNSDKIVIAPNVSWGNMKHSFACDSWPILDAK